MILDGVQYYYVKNLQGDVVMVLDGEGDTVASYVYDAWGSVVSQSGALAEINPIRYRGYYYDEETSLYYCKARYYNPQWGRWINADSIIDHRHVNGSNLWAYCWNNPIGLVDYNGKKPAPPTNSLNPTEMIMYTFYTAFIDVFVVPLVRPLSGKLADDLSETLWALYSDNPFAALSNVNILVADFVDVLELMYNVAEYTTRPFISVTKEMIWALLEDVEGGIKAMEKTIKDLEANGGIIMAVAVGTAEMAYWGLRMFFNSFGQEIPDFVDALGTIGSAVLGGVLGDIGSKPSQEQADILSTALAELKQFFNEFRLPVPFTWESFFGR
jgi:RHS repeat-associated protein